MHLKRRWAWGSIHVVGRITEALALTEAGTRERLTVLQSIFACNLSERQCCGLTRGTPKSE
jgi:hypothetical protein